jgi:hypothetical protein
MGLSLACNLHEDKQPTFSTDIGMRFQRIEVYLSIKN